VENYKVTIKPSAAKELESIDRKKDRQRIAEHILELAVNPRPHGSEKMTAMDKHFKLRQGDYRIVYEIDDAARTIFVKKIRNRREVYRTK